MSRSLPVPAPILPLVPTLRGTQQRHSIIDLSVIEPSKSDDSAFGQSSANKNSIRRQVASKRRPSASIRAMRSNISQTSAGIINEFEDAKEFPRHDNKYSVETETSEVRASTEPPGCRLVIKELGKDVCAIYEPVVTLRALSVFRPLFYRCLAFLEDPANIKNAKVESEGNYPSEEDISQLAGKLRDAASEFIFGMTELESMDRTFQALVEEIEAEHISLFRYQLEVGRESTSLQWETKDQQMRSLLPWDTQSLNRLEKLECKKEKLNGIAQTAQAVCQKLDRMICTHLGAVVSLMELLSPSQPGRPRLLSSLHPHPSLLRRKKISPSEAFENSMKSSDPDDKQDDSNSSFDLSSKNVPDGPESNTSKSERPSQEVRNLFSLTRFDVKQAEASETSIMVASCEDAPCMNLHRSDPSLSLSKTPDPSSFANSKSSSSASPPCKADVAMQLTSPLSGTGASASTFAPGDEEKHHEIESVDSLVC